MLVDVGLTPRVESAWFQLLDSIDGAVLSSRWFQNIDLRPHYLEEFKVLQDVDSVFRPGQLTLLLAPPGHGKTSLLKAISGNLPETDIEGSITYSGKTRRDGTSSTLA